MVPESAAVAADIAALAPESVVPHPDRFADPASAASSTSLAKPRSSARLLEPLCLGTSPDSQYYPRRTRASYPTALLPCVKPVKLRRTGR